MILRVKLKFNFYLVIITIEFCIRVIYGLFLDIKVTKYKKYIYKYYTI